MQTHLGSHILIAQEERDIPSNHDLIRLSVTNGWRFDQNKITTLNFNNTQAYGIAGAFRNQLCCPDKSAILGVVVDGCMIIQNQVIATVCGQDIITDSGNYRIRASAGCNGIAQTFIQLCAANFFQEAIHILDVASIPKNNVVAT